MTGESEILQVPMILEILGYSSKASFDASPIEDVRLLDRGGYSIGRLSRVS